MRYPGRARQVIRLRNLHDLPARRSHSPSGPMDEVNHLKPIHTGGTTSITTRRKPEDQLAADPDIT